MVVWRAVLLGMFVVTVGLSLGKVPLAQSPAELVKQRRADMRQMGKSFGPIIPIVRGQNQNASDAVEAITTMNRNANRILTNFPPGTGRDAVPTSRAKPEVWTKRAEFEAAAKKLVTASASLLEAAKANDVNAFRSRFRALATACGGCHRARGNEGGTFRFPKEQ